MTACVTIFFQGWWYMLWLLHPSMHFDFDKDANKLSDTASILLLVTTLMEIHTDAHKPLFYYQSVSMKMKNTFKQTCKNCSLIFLSNLLLWKFSRKIPTGTMSCSVLQGFMWWFIVWDESVVIVCLGYTKQSFPPLLLLSHPHLASDPDPKPPTNQWGTLCCVSSSCSLTKRHFIV